MMHNFSHAINCDSENMYSILHMLNDKYKINGKFEFLLEYPELGGCNRWKQSLNPLFDTDDSAQAVGYEGINISWSVTQWGGLVRSSQKSFTVLDGSCGSVNWHYAIGVYKGNSYSNTQCPPLGDCFPGPSSINRVVLLWVRINGNPPEECPTLYKNSMFKISLIGILSLILE